MTKAVQKLVERIAELESELKNTRETVDKLILGIQDITKRLIVLEEDGQERKGELSAIDLMHEYLTGETSYKAERKQ